MNDFTDAFRYIFSELGKEKDRYIDKANMAFSTPRSVEDVKEKIKEGLSPEEKVELLHQTFIGGNPDAINEVLKICPNIYSKNPTTGGNILHSAARGGCNLSLILNKELLKLVNINAKDRIYGRTPIIEASIFKNINSFQQLAKANADFTIADNDGNTALHYLELSKSKHKIDLKSITNETFKKALNQQNKDGETPLIQAIKKDPKTAIQLIQCGADVSIKDNSGNTALNYLALTSDPLIAEVFNELPSHLRKEVAQIHENAFKLYNVKYALKIEQKNGEYFAVSPKKKSKKNETDKKTSDNAIAETDPLAPDYDKEKASSLKQKLKLMQKYQSSESNETAIQLSDNKNNVSR